MGFADSRPRPTARVPELFVPLRLRKGEDKVWQTAELLRFLVTESKQTPRAVVLGDPGSGKTTLCRFLAVVLAGEAKLGDVAAGEDVLALFLPFREYVRQCRETGDCSLVAFLEQEAQNHLQVTLPKGFLEEKLEAGQAVVLLDGLDEVGSAGEREEMRERVLAFGRNHPKVPMLVTSRIAGYTEAPLPENGQDGFAHLHLAPFEDDDLRAFVRHWYAIQEADDPWHAIAGSPSCWQRSRPTAGCASWRATRCSRR
ncbi:MAG: NACHT domain-containing protein [Thermoanaerobaculia bacterium]|nr:NACHT domain-containing protein [Thermoanaerobaculia bacterium]